MRPLSDGLTQLDVRRMLFDAVFLRSALLVALLALTTAACGSDSAEAPPRDEPAAKQSRQPEEPEAAELVEVPDVTGMDGQEAVDTIEAEGLYATHDENDPAGCTVEDQDESGEVDPGTEVILSLDCRQRDWDNREGDVWDVFTSDFAAGVDQGCEALFSLAPDETLHLDDNEYTWTECNLAADDDPESAGVDIPAEVPEDPGVVARNLGVDHGCRALFDAELTDVLFYGTEGFTADDCIAVGE